MLTCVSHVMMVLSMACLLLALTCAGAAVPAAVLHDQDAVDQAPRRVQRSFGGDYSGYFGGQQGPSHDSNNMVNWKAALGKRGHPDKRQFEFYPASHFGSGLDRGSFQDWSATFGRNYRSFGNGNGHGGSLGSSGHDLGAEGLQNWRAFFGRQSRGDGFGDDEN